MSSQWSFLPTDETIFERSKWWADFLSRIHKMEDYEELYFDEIPSCDEDSEKSESEVDENLPLNNRDAIVRVSNFEGSSSSDEFDVEDILNETIPAIEERKRKWKESGMDRVLDTFDLNTITDKVGSWLKKSGIGSNITGNSSMEDAQIVHFEDHHIQFHSDDSLQSADTARYILSNRKPRATSCTTMTIKRFRYIKGKQKELQNKYNFDLNQNSGRLFPKEHPFCLPPVKSRRMSEAINGVKEPSVLRKPIIRRNTVEDCIKKSFPKEFTNRGNETEKTQKLRHKQRRSYSLRKKSALSSSDSNSNSSTPHRKPKFRRVSRKIKKKSNPSVFVDLTLSELSPSKEHVVTSNPNIQKTMELSNLKETYITPTSNNTCFLTENIVNSTTLSSTKVEKQAVNPKFCQLSPIVKNVSSEINDEKGKLNCQNQNTIQRAINYDCATTRKQNSLQNGHANSKSSDRKVLVYTPENNSLFQGSITKGSFKLTEEHLRKSIGEKASRRFIKCNPRKLPLEFSSTSKIFFKLPTDSENSRQSENSGESDEDVLNMFAKQGELLEDPIQTISNNEDQN